MSRSMLQSPSACHHGLVAWCHSTTRYLSYFEVLYLAGNIFVWETAVESTGPPRGAVEFVVVRRGSSQLAYLSPQHPSVFTADAIKSKTYF